MKSRWAAFFEASPLKAESQQILRQIATSCNLKMYAAWWVYCILTSGLDRNNEPLSRGGLSQRKDFSFAEGFWNAGAADSSAPPI